MKKQQKINLILVAAVVAIVLFIVFNNNSGTSTINNTEDEYSFSVEDTASITKIEISSKEPDTVILTRDGSKWMVNGQFPARHDAVEVLLETFHGIRLRYFPRKNAINNILARMGSYGKEVKVYQGDVLAQHFIVGTDNLDQLGTYMMKVDASQPYAMHIPGFNGYLSSRFFTREDLWRDRTIFGTDNLDIRELRMEYGAIPEEGFKIVQDESSKLAVYDDSGLPIENFSSQRTRYLLGSVRTLKFEGAIIPSDEVWPKLDSIRNSIPVFELTLIDKDNQTKILRAHHVPAQEDTYDDNGRLMIWDPDRFYAFINDKQPVLIQAYAFENLLKTREYFLLPDASVSAN